MSGEERSRALVTFGWNVIKVSSPECHARVRNRRTQWNVRAKTEKTKRHGDVKVSQWQEMPRQRRLSSAPTYYSARVNDVAGSLHLLSVSERVREDALTKVASTHSNVVSGIVLASTRFSILERAHNDPFGPQRKPKTPASAEWIEPNAKDKTTQRGADDADEREEWKGTTLSHQKSYFEWTSPKKRGKKEINNKRIKKVCHIQHAAVFLRRTEPERKARR